MHGSEYTGDSEVRRPPGWEIRAEQLQRPPQPHASATVTNYAGWLFVDLTHLEMGDLRRENMPNQTGLLEKLMVHFLDL